MKRADALRPIVFATSETRQDFTRAGDFGDIEFVTRDEPRSYTPLGMWHTIHRDIDSAITVYDPTKDFVILVGNPAIIGICTYSFLTKARSLGIAAISTLKWDKKEWSFTMIKILDLFAGTQSVKKALTILFKIDY